MGPHYSHSSRENATPSSGTSPLASYKGVPSPGAQYSDAHNSGMKLGRRKSDWPSRVVVFQRQRHFFFQETNKS